MSHPTALERTDERCVVCGGRTVSTVGSLIDGAWHCYNCAEGKRSIPQSSNPKTPEPWEVVTNYGRADLSLHPLVREAYKVACLIERCGASVELTQASSDAFGLCERLSMELAALFERAAFLKNRMHNPTWVLYLLQDGEISVGKAAEWLREYIRTGKEGTLPDVQALFAEETQRLLGAEQPEPMANKAAAIERFARRHDETIAPPRFQETLTTIASMEDESNEWDAVSKFTACRLLAREALAQSSVKSDCNSSASTDDTASPARLPPSSVECPKCRTQLAFEGDVCWLCQESANAPINS